MKPANLKKFRGFAEGGEIERVAPKQNFKSAFAEARSAGAGTFTWNGKKYTTELAKAKPAAPRQSNDDVRDKQASASMAQARKNDADENENFDSWRNSQQAAARKADTRSTGMGDEVGRLLKRAPLRSDPADEISSTFKRGGSVKKYASGGSVKCSRDGIAQRGKTKGRNC